jgi:hypothetical protein
MVKVICTTTINPPTEALKLFADMEGWQLVVAGDKKTPTNWHIPGAIYLSPELQEDYDKKLSDAIGWNCMQRRNFALLYAYDMGADVVAVVDDDNEPHDSWGKDLMVGQKVVVNYYIVDAPAFDPVGATNYKNLWHRGFPLELLSKRDYTHSQWTHMIPDVQADFWNGDPDIDAICRMEHAPECAFQSRYFPIAGSAMSPFNSQNIFMAGNLLKDYFLFPGIGRMDDIWASYYVQAKGAKVAYGKPSVYQKRNPHNLIEDMKAEYLGYEHNLEVVGNTMAMFKYIPKRAVEALELYKKHF